MLKELGIEKYNPPDSELYCYMVIKLIELLISPPQLKTIDSDMLVWRKGSPHHISNL